MVGNSKWRGTRKEKRVLAILPHSHRRRQVFKHKSIRVVIQKPLEITNGCEFVVMTCELRLQMYGKGRSRLIRESTSSKA
jgi:hypothetical protein